jgi:hypothetical protein
MVQVKRTTIETYIPVVVLVILAFAAIAFSELLGFARITGGLLTRLPETADFESIAGNSAAAPPPLPRVFGATYEATPDRVWQTTGRVNNHSRRAIMYLVSNGTGTKERKRAPEDFPPEFGGIEGADGYYVQHLLWSLKKAEANLLSMAQHPDVLILYSEDVDGPRLAREAAKLTQSAVVAAPIAFSRTAPGYENKTDGLTTCWPVDWCVRVLPRFRPAIPV